MHGNPRAGVIRCGLRGHSDEGLYTHTPADLRFISPQRLQTPLHIAAEDGRQDLVEMMLVVGVKLHLTDKVRLKLTLVSVPHDRTCGTEWSF